MDQLMLGYIMITLATMLILFYMLFLTGRKQQDSREHIVTEIRCTSCNFIVKRGFREGDYVGKIVDERCPRCGGEMAIESIYEEKIESATRSLLYRIRNKKDKK